MASEEGSLNLLAHGEVLRSFSFSDSETSVQQNLCCVCAHHNSLICQWVAVEDVLEMAQVLDIERRSME